MKVLTAPTCLYHPTLAPAGQVFAPGEDHPGEAWRDSPAGLAVALGEGAPAFIARLQLALEEAQAEIQQRLADGDRAAARITDLEAQLARRAAGRRKPKLAREGA